MNEIVLGVDIGATYTKFGLVDRLGNCFSDKVIETKGDTAEEFVTHFFSVINDIFRDHSEIELQAVGIGAPDGNYYKGTIEHAPNLPWKGIIPFVELCKNHTNVPVVLTNDANAAAIGEKLFGGGKDMDHFIVITLGTGLGSGIINDGKLVYGSDGFAGELGHTYVENGDRECGTGKKGCLEAYVSAQGIKRTVFELMATSTKDSEFRDITFNNLDAKMISDAAKRKDPLALEAFEVTGRILGKKLAEFVAFSSPEAVFLLGGLANAGELIFNPAKKYMEENLLEIYRGKVKLLPSGMPGKNAAILGAAALAWETI